MTSTMKTLPAGKDAGLTRMIVSLDITSTSLSNVTASAYSAFTRGFAEVPNIIGVNTNIVRGSVSASATSVGISLYISGYKDGITPDGTAVVTATIEGYLA
jgi:hypothetical protein